MYVNFYHKIDVQVKKKWSRSATEVGIAVKSTGDGESKLLSGFILVTQEYSWSEKKMKPYSMKENQESLKILYLTLLSFSFANIYSYRLAMTCYWRV